MGSVAYKQYRHNELKHFYSLHSKKNNDFFFGENNWNRDESYRYRFTQAIDNDNIIVVSKNIVWVKGNPILLISNQRGVYLKDWQIRTVYKDPFTSELPKYVIKLNRKFFKVYTFSNSIGECYDNYTTFDDFLSLARQQEKEKKLYGFV